MFTIIIPVYKVAKYLRATVDSVLAQTNSDFEVVCVDDGSPDECGVILDEYAVKDNRVKVIHKQNGGVSSARNAGMDSATGDWLLFLDGDDLLAPDTLSVLEKGQKDFPSVDMFRFGYVEFENDVTYERQARVSPRFVDIKKEIALVDLASYMWQFAYRRTMLGQLRFDLSYHRMEDRPFVCDCLLNRNNGFVDLRCDCLGYRQRSSSAMRTIPPTHVWDGEIRYRIELIRMLDMSGKKCKGFVESDWIGEFFGWPCLHGIVYRSEGDRRQLMQQWQNAISFMRSRAELSRFTRFKYWLCQYCDDAALSVLIIDPIRYFRNCFRPLQPIAKLYRRLLRHGEFSNTVR